MWVQRVDVCKLQEFVDHRRVREPGGGALRAGMYALGRDLRAGSERLAWLDERLPAFMAGGGELVCYVLLRDWMVGARNAAPPGQEPWWLDGAGWGWIDGAVAEPLCGGAG